MKYPLISLIKFHIYLHIHQTSILHIIQQNKRARAQVTIMV